MKAPKSEAVSIKAPSAAASVPFSTRLPTDVIKALDEHAVKTGRPKTVIIDKALRRFLKMS